MTREGGPGAGRERESAFDRAARLLAQRPHFRAALARKLRQKDHEPAEIEEALARLGELGYLDDAKLAAAEAERLRERKGLGRAGVAAELARKGASRQAIDLALGEDDAEAERERALEVGRRWLARGRRDAAALARHLDRKGFPAAIVRGVVRETLDADGGD